MKWRLARSLEQLRAEVDAAFPHRPKDSDGTLGDPAHAARVSDHNPNDAGVVRAFDCTNIPEFPQYAEHIRGLGASGFPALQNHGYVIHNGRAAYATKGWVWVPYTGENPHRKHTHVSVGRDPAQYDSPRSWGINAISLEEFTVDAEAKARFEALEAKVAAVQGAVLTTVRPSRRLVRKKGDKKLWVTDLATYRRDVGAKLQKRLTEDFLIGDIVELDADESALLDNVPEVK